MRLYVLVAVAVLAICVSAHADDIVQYSLSGEESVDVPGYLPLTDLGPVTGSLTVDSTTNYISARIGDFFDSGPICNGDEFIDNGGLGYNTFEIYYLSTGGYFMAENEIPYYYVNGIAVSRVDYQVSGIVGPKITPEPSSIALFGTGIVSVAGLLRKRFANSM